MAVKDVGLERIVVFTVRSKDGMEVSSEIIYCFHMGFSPAIIWLKEGGGEGFEG